MAACDCNCVPSKLARHFRGGGILYRLVECHGYSIVRREQAYQQAITPFLEERARIEAVEAMGVQIATDGGYANYLMPYPQTRLSMADIVQFSRLTDLTLTQPIKDPENFTNIASMPRLRSVRVSKMKFSREQFAAFGALPSISGLKLIHCDITDADLSILTNCKHLEYVGFVDTRITSQQVDQLCALDHLVKFGMHNTGISVEDIRRLLNVPGLSMFLIGTKDLSKAEYEMLERSKPSIRFNRADNPGF